MGWSKIILILFFLFCLIFINTIRGIEVVGMMNCEEVRTCWSSWFGFVVGKGKKDLVSTNLAGWSSEQAGIPGWGLCIGMEGGVE